MKLFIPLIKRVFIAFLLSLSFLSVSMAEISGLQDFKGQPQKLENFTGKGKWLVVMIWASDCHICNREVYQYVDFNMVHSDDDATVLGISIDGEAKKKDAESFIRRHSVDFPNLIGEPEYIATIFQDLTGQYFRGTPSILIFSPRGELKAADAGAVPTELIEKFIEQQSAKSVKK